MGYIFNSMMRDYDRNRRKTLKARDDQRAEKAAATALRRAIGGVRCPQCWQEAYVAKYALPQTGPPPVLCTCPDGHQYQVQNGQLVPPQPGRRVR